jgi:hypothetical protein
VQVECNPCHHLTCPIDHRCAGRLSVQDVLAQVRAVLGDGGVRHRRAHFHPAQAGQTPAPAGERTGAT